MSSIERLRNLISVARGLREPDLVLKGGAVVNLFSHEIITADVALYDGMIAGVGSYAGKETIDATGCYISPGFIDGHMHLESTMLAPAEFAKAAIKRGTTAVFADPHEIANVLGSEGIKFMLAATKALPVDIRFLLPSCIPATGLETSGAALRAADLKPLRNLKRIAGLAEMMNYPGVINGDEETLAKLLLFAGRIRDGHAPLLSGFDLNGYAAVGIGSDHECSNLEEAREKLRLGMHIMIRQGTLAKNMSALLPLVTSETIGQFSLVTDDLHPHDLLENGHLDCLVDLAVASGLTPLQAIRMVTLNPARYFGLRDVGAVAPGFRADLLVLASLAPVAIKVVVKDGRPVFDRGELTPAVKRSLAARMKVVSRIKSSINIKDFAEKALSVRWTGKRIRVIGLIPDQLVTRQLFLMPKKENGFVVSDTKRDILKLAVFERHSRTGGIGVGFVRGFGLKKGALASSVAHDSHNIVVVGCNDGDMAAAVRAIKKMNGGLVAVCDGKVVAGLPLPVAGLMADASLEEVAALWRELRRVSHQLGAVLPEPFMALSFLALPVIPELRLTDRGLVDVNLFRSVNVFTDF